jgi:hypothetical protein
MMRVRLALSVLALVGLVAVPGASTRDPARAFLTAAFNLSPATIGHIDDGQIVAQTLEVKNRREVATLGVVRIQTTPAVYVERLRDIANFKRTDGVLQIRAFSSPPQQADIASLTVDDGDLKLLRECRVENCSVRLSADGIERIRHEIDWRATDAAGRASSLVRQLLVDYVTRYREGGAAAAMEYADRPSPLNVGHEFASLVDADTATWKYVPRLRRHLLEYPASTDEAMSDFIYWSKERVHSRPVISITHVAIATALNEGPVNYAIASKQIYAMHYFDASLGLTVLVRDPSAPFPATYVVYLNRSRIDLFDGMFGGVARRIAAARARSLVAEQLARLQRSFAVGE